MKKKSLILIIVGVLLICGGVILICLNNDDKLKSGLKNDDIVEEAEYLVKTEEDALEKVKNVINDFGNKIERLEVIEVTDQLYVITNNRDTEVLGTYKVNKKDGSVIVTSSLFIPSGGIK